jgi:hypothetical protein
MIVTANPNNGPVLYHWPQMKCHQHWLTIAPCRSLEQGILPNFLLAPGTQPGQQHEQKNYYTLHGGKVTKKRVKCKRKARFSIHFRVPGLETYFAWIVQELRRSQKFFLVLFVKKEGKGAFSRKKTLILRYDY